MKSLEKHIYKLTGFMLPDYWICFREFSYDDIPPILTDNFTIDKDAVENDFENYPLEWLKITHKLLWQIDVKGSTINIYSNTLKAISDNWATSLCMSKDLAFKNLETIVQALAEAHFFIEKFVFNIEGNWLLKRRNEDPSGLVRLFIFWAASKKLLNFPDSDRCFSHFLNCYANDCNLDEYDKYSDEEIIGAFMQSFYRNINEISVFHQILEKELVF